MSIKDMTFSPESQSAPHSFRLCDCPRSHEPLRQAVPGRFLLTSELPGEFIALQDLPYLWYDENTGFDLCLRQLRKEVLKVLEGCRLLI